MAQSTLGVAVTIFANVQQNIALKVVVAVATVEHRTTFAFYDDIKIKYFFLFFHKKIKFKTKLICNESALCKRAATTTTTKQKHYKNIMQHQSVYLLHLTICIF